jgi:hypothetical protein
MFRVVLPKIEGPGIIRTGLDAGPASDAPVVVDGHNAILPLVSGFDGTNRNAGRDIALHAGARQKMPGYLGIDPHFLLENGTIYHPGRQMIFRDTGRRAGVTSHALD